MIQQLGNAIVDTVRESGGAPDSVIYLALQTRFTWWTVDIHTKVISALVNVGRLKKSNNFLTA